MRSLDFSSWFTVLTTLLSLGVVTLIGVGIRLILMQTIQQRRERENRQVNERLKILIAAYKTLGGSFTGNLAVDPTHLRDVRQAESNGEGEATDNERARRIRDAVEAALSDILLLGNEEHVRLATNVANELVAGRRVETAALVQSLRDFIRNVLDLEPVPTTMSALKQGPARPAGGSGGKSKPGAARNDARGGAGGGGRGGGMGGGGEAGAHVDNEQAGH